MVVHGSGPRKLLIRGIGPSLGAFDVAGALARPRLQLFAGSTPVRQNEHWAAAVERSLVEEAAAKVGAFPLSRDRADAALLLYLAPGNYSAQLGGVNNSTGNAMVEVYDVP